MGRLTKPEFKEEIVQTMSGGKVMWVADLYDEGKITCINGCAYTAVDMALLKLKTLEDMIDKGELVDVTVFDSFMAPPEEQPVDEEGVIAVLTDEYEQ